MRISLIVAMTADGLIGAAGDLPWRLSADLRRFKQLTMGHHLVMGRKTFASIGRPLPGRTSIVLTRQPEFAAAGVLVAHSLDEALALAAGDDEVFVIGGAEVYRSALPRAERMYLTRVHARLDGDTYFPAWDQAAWRLIEEADFSADEKNVCDYSFHVLERVRPAVPG